MSALELKVPPPVVALLMAAAMWGVALSGAPIDIPDGLRHVLAATFALCGGCISVAGIIGLRRARTTVNPLKPENASSLVTAGVYRFTRNPMYLGLVFVLLGWAVLLSSVWALLGPIAFVLYIDRFQIEPEERALAATFGASLSEYRARVRRWI